MDHNNSRGIRRHFNYSNVMSTLSVFLVIAGGSALAAALPNNSVRSKTVKNNALKSVDLKDGRGVRSADVADNSLTGSDVVDGGLTGADLGPNSVGTSEIASNAVTTGKLADAAVTTAKLGNGAVTSPDIASSAVSSGALQNGAVGPQKLGPINTHTASFTVPAGTSSRRTAQCGPNERPLSWGVRWTNSDDTFINLWIMESFNTGTGWTVRGVNPGAAPREMVVIVYCLA